MMILADKGHLKAYSLEKNNHKKQKINLIEFYENSTLSQKMGQRITDKSGNFGKKSRMNGTHGFGEHPNIILELEKKAIKDMASYIDSIVTNSHCTEWYFASNKTLNNRILTLLSPIVKDMLKEDLPVNLMNSSKIELLHRFHIA